MKIKMITHYIILSSSYSTGKRIALHFPFESEIDNTIIDGAKSKIEKCYEGASFGVHVTQTESFDWDSVVDSDPYFKGIKVIDTVEEFVELIKKDRYFKGIDVAQYILTLDKCTHARLEKITYMCYADYLKETGKKLFTDEIYAFASGPVIETVYDTFKSRKAEESGKWIDTSQEIDDTEDIKPKFERLPIRSKLLFAECGLDKVRSIDKTVERCKDFSTQELTDITHREDSPWSHVMRKGRYDLLSDEPIVQYHSNEI